MGTVYRCQHALLRRPTAMKLLDGQLASPETVPRFQREVQIASELTHPHTVQIYDFGRTDDDIFYIAMELLPGLNLYELVDRSGPVRFRRIALSIFCGKQVRHCAKPMTTD
jgi:serine/threonine protein kinase